MDTRSRNTISHIPLAHGTGAETPEKKVMPPGVFPVHAKRCD